MYQKLSKLWAGLLFVFNALLLPLYIPKNGYLYIGTDKFHFFFCGMCILTLLGIPLFIYAIVKKKLQLFKFSKTDIFVLCFAVFSLISYLFSIDRKIGLIGNEEWNMGLISQLLFVIIYFGISRYLTHIKCFIYAVCVMGVPMALLAALNRFGFYPLPIKGQHYLYVSTIGNINWFCGFFIMITAMEMVLYSHVKTRREKWLLGSALFISFLAMICQGSISGYVTILVLLLLLLKPALKDKKVFLVYLEIYLLLFGACSLLYMTGYFMPGRFVEYDPITYLVAFSPLPLICLFVTVLMHMLVNFMAKDFNLTCLYKYVAGFAGASFVGYLLLCLINTLFPAITPFLNEISAFTFDRFWWSTRGGTYTIGVQAYISLPWWRWFVGIGPDCFLTYVYDNLDKVTMAKCFNLQPLANAHNEFLTMLVNTGLLGIISYAGIFVSSIKNALNKEKPFMKVILFGILGYMINNLFSFQQVISTSFVFVLLGMLENLLRKEHKNASN